MSTIRISAACLVAVIVFCCIGGCQDSNSQTEQIRATVEEYNRLLPDAYLLPQPSLLEEVAGEAEVNRVIMYVLYLEKKKEIIDTRMLDLEFDDVEISEDGTRAVVTTTEEWDYRMLDLDTREPKGEYVPITYRSTYTLNLADDRWMIVRLEVDELP